VTVPDRTISLSRTAESSARPVLTAEKLSEVVEWSHGLVDSGELPHGAVLVAHRGSVVLADAYGPSRPLESHDAIRHGTSEDTLFRLYSMTKPIAAALAMVMVDEGRMKLSDPLSKHLPAFASTPATIYGGAGGTVQGEPTVKQLLQHRAGIYCPEFPQLFSWVESNLDDFSDPHTRLQRTVDTIAGEPLVHQPGSDFVYGIQYDVLGRLLEVVGGMPLDELFEVKIFEPLEMKRTTFRQDPTLISSLATVCQPSARGLIDVAEQNTRPGVSTCHPLGYFCAGEGLIATMEDFYRFAGALANGGAPPQGNPGRRFLSEESAHYMTTNQLAGDTATVRAVSSLYLLVV
jgi:CubicO group peptidase (beta-lactamase class C family)